LVYTLDSAILPWKAERLHGGAGRDGAARDFLFAPVTADDRDDELIPIH
jgi:hypothetical protein